MHFLRRSFFARVFLLSSLFHWAPGARAQDTRTVPEPHIPSACLRLPARLTTQHDDLRDRDEDKLDTSRIQTALDHCASGHAVELIADRASNAFLSGPISIPARVTLLVDQGVTLFASRDPAIFQIAPGTCGLVNSEPPGCRPLISVHDAPHAAVMGDGVIDGRGGDKLLHGSVSWWQLAEQARSGGRQQVPRLVVVNDSDDFTAFRITLKNSPNFHLTFSNGRGFTAWGVRIDTPRDARNTDGIDPGGSASDITITHCFISTGDDNVAIKGSGTGVQHMSVIANHFYAGHGMSIGSETFGGVSDVLVRDLTLDGADNGIRIKSNIHRGGLVQRITYDDIYLRDVKLPITLDTRYDNPGEEDNLIPDFRDILLHDVSVIGAGRIIVDGQDPQHSTTVQLNGVDLDHPGRYQLFAQNAVITYGPEPVNFRLNGDNVHERTVAVSAAEKGKTNHSCSLRFVPFPRQP